LGAVVKPLDPTWWRRDRSGEFYSQQNDSARLVKVRGGRKVTGWALYINGKIRGQWPTLEEAKLRALEALK
jgi:hypothetical protein